MAIDKLVIDRALWGTGALLNADGTMCCLGFASIACGVPKEKLRFNHFDGTSSILGFPQVTWPEINNWMCDDGPTTIDDARCTAARATTINDSAIPGPDKESQLIEIFAKNEVELSFTGEYRSGTKWGNF